MNCSIQLSHTSHLSEKLHVNSDLGKCPKEDWHEKHQGSREQLFFPWGLPNPMTPVLPQLWIEDHQLRHSHGSCSFPPNLSCFYPFLQLLQALPGNPQAAAGREGNKLTADLHLPLWSTKPKSPDSILSL